VLGGDRAVIGRAVTLLESTRKDHQQLGQDLITALLPHTGNSIRLGISGVPGVGKSTFIESFGLHLINEGKRVAVLAVDPTSERTGGSILGDKTRMHNLSTNPNAFIRPSPTSGVLGGVNRLTRESILLFEAAGFDTIIVETVGIGQSETMVASMVDCFIVLMLPGAGDDLQGIKRGVMEMADIILINKADGKNQPLAESAKNDYTSALRTLKSANDIWHPPVLTCSALHHQGLDEAWQTILEFHSLLSANGELQQHRANQTMQWLQRSVEQHLLHDFYANDQIKIQRIKLEQQLIDGKITPAAAAKLLISTYKST